MVHLYAVLLDKLSCNEKPSLTWPKQVIKFVIRVLRFRQKEERCIVVVQIYFNKNSWDFFKKNDLHACVCSFKIKPVLIKNKMDNSCICSHMISFKNKPCLQDIANYLFSQGYLQIVQSNYLNILFKQVNYSLNRDSNVHARYVCNIVTWFRVART